MKKREKTQELEVQGRWVGYEPKEDSCLNWTAVKDLAALDI